MHVRIIKKKGRSLFLLSCEILHLIKGLHFPWVWQKKWGLGNFPASPMVKTLLPMQGHDYDPCLGNWDPTSPHLACTPPAVLRHPAIQRVALRTARADLGRGSRTGAAAAGCWRYADLLTSNNYGNTFKYLLPDCLTCPPSSQCHHQGRRWYSAVSSQSLWPPSPFYISTAKGLRRRNSCTSPSSKSSSNGIHTSCVTKKKRKRSLHWINVLIPHLI